MCVPVAIACEYFGAFLCTTIEMNIQVNCSAQNLARQLPL